MSDTIFALASGRGAVGVAVYRLSGPGAGPALSALTGKTVPARMAVRARVRNGSGEIIDDGLVLWFPGPASFTGEDVVELHLHGGRAVERGLREVLLELGLRPAEPGEFSRRAVVNGKLDLTRAEAMADLIAAETVQQRRQALLQLDGGLGRLVEEWRSRLVGILAHTEALIDFADEDLPDGVGEGARRAAQALTAEMRAILADDRRGERLRDGCHVAILGAPNAGKSSLLNRIAGRDAAIVSSIEGTTRDIIDIHLDLDGWPVVLADTAGLRDADSPLEEEGIRRAVARGSQADVTLVVFDGARLPDLDPASLAMIDGRAVVVVNKGDVIGRDEVPAEIGNRPVVVVSAATGEGMDGLLSAMARAAEARLGGGSVFTRDRHRAAALAAIGALERFTVAPAVELAAEEGREAVRALGRITGHIDVEEVLDNVFRDFCIGK
jgi:tRNA modification GTPase